MSHSATKSYPSRYTAFRRSPGKGSREKPLTIEQCQETLPNEKDLEPHDVVIKIHSVSLNYRDVGILIGNYPMDVEDSGIPCSDCSAEVVAIGSAVQTFKKGDIVAPICAQGDFDPTDDGFEVGVGINASGMLREYAIFKEKHIVHLPRNLTYDEGAMLPCAGLTAWNSLDSLKIVRKHSSALMQGTGGVSMFSVLFCLAAGIAPIVTSSSDVKIKTIQEKVSNKVRGINYKTEDQGARVKELTNGRGVDFVVNNTGVGSLIDDISYLCQRGGTVSLVGFLAGFDADWKPVQMMDLMKKAAKLKGIAIGSKADFVEMNRFIEEKNTRFDMMLHEVFDFKDSKKAFDTLYSGKFSGKINITVT